MTFLTALELIQICLQGELSHRRIGGVVVDIERFVLPACADLFIYDCSLLKMRASDAWCWGGFCCFLLLGLFFSLVSQAIYDTVAASARPLRMLVRTMATYLCTQKSYRSAEVI